ncbi:hypothetical protein [Streptomyces sp. 1222.5]|uniref:hypothetical protein n=1 Tax=Streptomyces sp. 1222.5 TaxID=1881026 RepID=UPI003EBD4AE5
MLPSKQTGRDGRPLVPTELAAYSLGMTPKQFRDWARRRVRPASYERPPGRRGQASAMYDLADLADVAREERTGG